ncbi:hypothetical protein C8R43DRAFT_1242469 [Mycena crocata]|nr:hypothetical protein C8R43DRAFT_1242469 [Mycena crocata]
MLTLPDELLLLISTHFNRQELWALVRVSSRLRRIALLPLLALYNVSETQIQSGEICLTEEAYFLIIVISNIHPIHRLVVPTGKVPLKTLQSILSVVPPIPDVVVANDTGMFKNTRGVAGIISTASKSSSSPLVIVSRGTISVSLPRRNPPIQWKWVPQPTWLTTSSFTFRRLIADAAFLVPLSLTYLLAGVINSGVLAAWLLRSVVVPEMDDVDRITEHLGVVQCQWMRIQAVAAGSPDQFTLVTFGGTLSSPLVIRPLFTLTERQRSAVWATLALPEHLTDLIVSDGSSAPLSDIFNCVTRHPALTRLLLQPTSISPASLDNLPLPLVAHLADVRAPAFALPHILCATPNVRDITMTFPRGEPGDFDVVACIAVLDAIADLPGTHSLALTIYFRKDAFDARALPWHVGTSSKPLPRVERLSLETNGASGASVEIKLLARWLKACFPSIIQLQFPGMEDGEVPSIEDVQGNTEDKT